MLLCSHVAAASKGHLCVKCCYVHVRQDWLFYKKGVKRNRFVLNSWLKLWLVKPQGQTGSSLSSGCWEGGRWVEGGGGRPGGDCGEHIGYTEQRSFLEIWLRSCILSLKVCGKKAPSKKAPLEDFR